MLTRYIIPCSCGCGADISRFIFSSHVCQVRGQRDKIKKEVQTFRVNGGEEVVVQEIATKSPKFVEVKSTNPEWQAPANLSKAHFARRKQGSKHK